MCIGPRRIAYQKNGETFFTDVSCKVCYQCEKMRLDDFVGRCMCEASESDWTLCATFTYADGPARDQDGAHRIILPRHFQNAVKQIRNRGHSVRYFVVGEYGGRTGRAHFHALLFGYGPGLGWHQGWNYPAGIWDHGHVDVDLNPDVRAVRYIVKYLWKADKKKRWFSLSKKPPLGFAFFLKLARRDHEIGALPSSFAYCPPGVNDRRTYYMTGASRREYLFERCRLAGVDPLELASRGSEQLLASAEKLDAWWARKLRDRPSLDEVGLDMVRYLDLRRPSAQSVVWSQLYGLDLHNFEDDQNET